MKHFMKYFSLATFVAFFHINACQAWFVEGWVLCDSQQTHTFNYTDAAVQGVLVEVANVSGTFSSSNWTTPQGFYIIGLPEVPDTYVVTLHPLTLPSGTTEVVPPAEQFTLTSSMQTSTNNFLIENPDCVNSGCTIQGVTISDTSWNAFKIPAGTSPVVWVHAHIGKPGGLSTSGVTVMQFENVRISLNGVSYALPEGMLVFNPSASAQITTTYSNGTWVTVANPNALSDEIFFTGAAIPVTASIANGAKATLSYNTLISEEGVSFNWQWSAAVYTQWPADWNQAQIQAYHSSYHAGTPLNPTVQKSLIQGPRGGGGANFTGSWSATGHAECQ